jgi:hypothetical protein
MCLKRALGGISGRILTANIASFISIGAGVGWPYDVDNWFKIAHVVMPICHSQMVGSLDTLKALLTLELSVLKQAGTMFWSERK